MATLGGSGTGPRALRLAQVPFKLVERYCTLALRDAVDRGTSMERLRQQSYYVDVDGRLWTRSGSGTYRTFDGPALTAAADRVEVDAYLVRPRGA